MAFSISDHCADREWNKPGRAGRHGGSAWQSSPSKPRQPRQPTEQYNAEIWGRILLAHSHIQCTWDGIHLYQTNVNIPTYTWKVSYFAINFVLYEFHQFWVPQIIFKLYDMLYIEFILGLELIILLEHYIYGRKSHLKYQVPVPFW